MTTDCTGDLTCQQIVDGLEADLNTKCDEFGALLDDKNIARRAYYDARKAAG